VKAIGLVWSFGRTSLCELLGMWERQTLKIPLLVWLDVGSQQEGDTRLTPLAGCDAHPLVPHVTVVRARRRTLGRSLASMRNDSILWAECFYDLLEEDALVILEDDDFYASTHAERCLDVLTSGHQWVGSRRVGQQWHAGRAPELCSSTGGPGPHAQWAYRLGAYLRAGGYPDVEQDDIGLMARMNAAGIVCEPHWLLSYVRREHESNLSRHAYDVEAVRTKASLAVTLKPAWNAELDALERWCEHGLQRDFEAGKPPSP
jgi:hypothetical protein